MQDRDYKVDMIKTVAILCVISIHATSYGWTLYPAGSAPWVANMFWASVTRAAVPLFLMCSGALFLDPARELSIKKLYTKYLPRVIVAMLVWAMAYKINYIITYESFSGAALWQGFKEILIFKQEFHLYYIHIIIMVYICLPVVRVISANASKKQLEYCIAIWFIFGILYPTIGGLWPFSLITGTPKQWLINNTYAAIGYLLLGYYVRFVSTFRRRHYLIISGAGFSIAFFGTWFASIYSGEFVERFLGGMSVGVAMMAFGIVGLCPAKKSRVTVWCSKSSFCIYLVHVFFLRIFYNAGFSVGLFTPALSAPLVTAAIFLCSFIVYLILSHIPVVNKWLI